MRVGQSGAVGLFFQRIQSTVDSSRYLVLRFSHSPTSSRLLPIFAVLTTVLVSLFSLIVRFAHPLTAIVLFYHIFRRVLAFYQSKLGGAWAPAFPLHRTAFILTVGTIPIWGCAMAGGDAGQKAGGHAGYESMPLNVEDVEDLQEEERRRRMRKEPAAPSSTVGARLRWLALFAFYLSLALFGLHMWKTYELPIDHRFKARVELANTVPRREGYSTGEKVYIAAMFYNNGGVLPYWIQQTTRLIHYLGPDNVFVSIVESNSGDNTASLLEAFSASLTTLSVAHKVTTHDTSIPRPPSMGTAPPRIQFLSAVRNLVMEPLVASGGYTRVLWSNDVFIEAESMAELIHTRDGDYDMVCGLDLAYWGLYDQWVIRDRHGRFASTLWPYFLEETGYRAVERDDPAPVSACWNGITAMRADPFLPLSLRKGIPAFRVPVTSIVPVPASDSEPPHTQPWSLSHNPLPQFVTTHPSYPRPANATALDMPPLKFRASAPNECFSSESFLLPYDLRRVFGMESIFVNPRVINSYSWEFYVYFKYITRHWVVKWFIERVENGYGFHQAQMILGGAARAWVWDGGDCHPWW
ncbi:cryptococcal mannosyltransferase 1-domain-containing protein [Mycena amicta]|nr:cryptococcal mannosyltransferase 1-domain-containing protein [Mycena amicta]